MTLVLVIGILLVGAGVVAALRSSLRRELKTAPLLPTAGKLPGR